MDPKLSKRAAVMVISMNSSNSGFRKWSEAQELKRIGEVRAGAAEGGGDVPLDLDQVVITPDETPHRPWLVPGAGKL
jgi:hypothetical protein